MNDDHQEKRRRGEKRKEKRERGGRDSGTLSMIRVSGTKEKNHSHKYRRPCRREKHWEGVVEVDIENARGKDACLVLLVCPQNARESLVIQYNLLRYNTILHVACVYVSLVERPRSDLG